MKKTYLAPSTTATLIRFEGMLAASIKVGGDSKVTDENQVLSNDRLWDSSNWSDMEEE